jgi:hypothetical protein
MCTPRWTLPGVIRFGPDVEWISELDYEVFAERAAAFISGDPIVLAVFEGRCPATGIRGDPPENFGDLLLIGFFGHPLADSGMLAQDPRSPFTTGPSLVGSRALSSS